MKQFIIAFLSAVVVVQAFASDGGKEIRSSIVLKDECSSETKFNKLFELSSSGKYTGTAQIQYLAEANETSFMNCPEEFLSSMIKSSEKERNAVLRHFGIVMAPWDIADKLNMFRQRSEYKELIETRLSGFFKIKKPF